MASLSNDPDIEAQTNSPAIKPATIPNSLPIPNTANPQLPSSSSDPQPQGANSNQHHNGPETHVPKKWWETLNKQVKIRRHRLSQSLRKTVGYRAGSTVDTNALEWTLTALDEDQEVEDFAARVPGFFDSSTAPDATSAVLSLMSHQLEPNTDSDPILGSRLYDLLRTCIPGTSTLDETTRKHRLHICMKCLWYFGRAYNQPGISHSLPSYFPNSLIPEITRSVQAEEDPALRVMGRCIVAMIINKLAVDHKSGTIPVDDGVLACLSAMLGSGGHELVFLRHQPSTVALANMISVAFGEVGTLVADAVPPDVLDMAQQTLGIFGQVPPAQENAEILIDQQMSEFDGSSGEFEQILVSSLLLDFLDPRIQVPSSSLTQEVRTSCLRMCLKRLWFFGRAFNQRGNSVHLPSYVRIAFSDPEMIRRICKHHDFAVRAIGRCVGALVVNKLLAEINSRTAPVSHAEEGLECLSVILGTESRGVEFLLGQPGAVALANIVSLVFDEAGTWVADTVPSDVLDVVQQTLGLLSQALPVQESAELQLDQPIAITNISSGKFESILVSRLLDLLETCIHWHVTSPLEEEVRTSCLWKCLKRLWYFERTSNQLGTSVAMLAYICVTFTNPVMAHRTPKQRDIVIRNIGRCVGALLVNMLAADLDSRNTPVDDDELACLSAILGIKRDNVIFMLHHQGAVGLTNMILFTLANVDDSASARVPSDVLNVVQHTFGVLSQPLPAEWNIKNRLDQSDTLMNVSDEASTLIPVMYKRILSMCLKNLWNVVRASNEKENSVPLPSYIRGAFTHSVTSRRIHKGADFATGVMGRCVGALVVNKLAADLYLRTDSIRDMKLDCISTILGTRNDDVMLLLRHQGSIELTNMIFFALANIDDFTPASVPSDVLDVVQQTLGILTQALPAELGATMRLDQTDMNVSDGSSSLIPDMYKRVSSSCLKDLWNVVRASNERGNSAPLPSYIYATFTHSGMTRPLRKGADFTTGVMKICTGVLVVNKLAADLNARTDSIRDVELQCISTILGTKKDDVMHLLRHQGAIELTNMFFFALANIDDSASVDVPSDVLDVIHQAFAILSQALPAEWNIKLQQDQTDTTMNVSDGQASRTSYLTPYVCLKNLWNVIRESSERGKLVPLQSSIYGAFTNSMMSRRIHQDAGLTTSVIGYCVEALVVNKLTADINSRNVPVNDDELACLSAILGTKIPLQTQPGAIVLAGVVSLVSDIVRSLVAKVVSLDVLDVVQQTLDLISGALPAEGIAQQHPDQTISLTSVSNTDFEHVVSSDLQKFLKAYMPNTSLLTAEVRTSSLRICLKSMWCFARLYLRHDTPMPLPSYFPLEFASPEITHLIRTELDPTARVIGRCFEALVVDKLVADVNSLTDDGVACLSAILASESHIVWLWLDQPGAIDLRNVVSVISDEIDTFVADELPTVVVEIFQHTLSIIARQISRGRGSADEDLYMDQVLYFHNICSLVADRGGPEWLRYRLDGILTQLPAVEDRDRQRRSDLISDGQLSESGADDSSLSSSASTGN